MRIDELPNPRLAQVRVSNRPADDSRLLDLAVRIVVMALGSAVLFLAARIVGQF